MIHSLAIASDHGGIDFKSALLAHLQQAYPQISVIDLGTDNTESVDYPDFADKVAGAITSGKVQAGILICGTGIGISMRANRHKGIRAALVYTAFTAEMAKAHNNANVLCLGARTSTVEETKVFVDIWLKTDFEGGRHQRRVEKLDL